MADETYTLCADTTCGKLARETGYCELHGPEGAMADELEKCACEGKGVCLWCVTKERDDIARDLVNVRANREEANRSRLRSEAENDALRERVRELEADLLSMQQQNERDVERHCELMDERDAARAKALEEAKGLVYTAIDDGELMMAQGGPLASRIDALKAKP